MKGLFVKDTLIFSNYKKNIIFTTIIFVVLIFLASIDRSMLTYGTLIFVLMFGMNSISTFSYDEATNTDEYLLSMGISRKDIVKSKYLMALFTLTSSILVGFVISLIASILVRANIEGVYDSIKNILMAFTGVSFLMCSDIPCIYKWGVEKGRMQAVIVPVILLFILGFIIFTLFIISPSLYLKIMNVSLDKIILPLLILLNIVIYFVSYKISYYIFERKDL